MDAVKSISVFFPCFNEQENIERVVKSTVDCLLPLGVDYEIIIVNDGSKDNTAQVADALAAGDNHIKAVRHKTNLGYGAALRSGFAAATKEFVFYTDGDGQFDIKELPAMFKYMADYDIVSGYRLKRRDNLMRKINAFCWTTLVCILFRMRIKDIDGAFKLYRRSIFDDIKMKSTGALINTEIFARAKNKGYKITQVGVHHYPRTAGTQTGAKLSVILRAFKELFVLYRQIKRDN
ncbi:MAG TPA: glycosyltransferase family 2 protein [Phycisphaerales bacterium]|nr:MAG: cell wall biosynthesis glycosyltransferase [Planctomycetes bacterium GWC2_45_44]HBG78741.1 glycosyltransferase family 2 protein [Phycisphaerales bacterium]HBR20386.1 glycosyltransferase family 2 protein [Phycisphaerales bacterium]